MRTALLFFGVALSVLLRAQPGDVDPCRFPTEGWLDVNGDGIHDISIRGTSEGTDDEPSSNGTCTRGVQCLAGTTLLHAANYHGPRDVRAFTVEQELTPEELEKGIRAQQLMWGHGMVPVVHWGYGGRGGTPLVVMPEISSQVFVLRTERDGAVWLTSVRVQYDADTRLLAVVKVAQVKEGEVLPLR
ncbi:MAG: hypothetical protein IPL52_09080 [Flavobacteriales bacterium]|nr:hypothetical protein [Flavobacteriales bacterium]